MFRRRGSPAGESSRASSPAERPDRPDRPDHPTEAATWQRSRLSAFLILGALLIFLFVKLEFRIAHSNLGLYAYGVTVTSVVLVQMAFAMLRYRDPALEFADIGEEAGLPPPVVSCMVAVHNEEEIITQCIASLCGQTYQHTEVIVVDDASTDSTPEILDGLAERHPIRVIKLPRNVGKKRALGQAMQKACGEVFAFSDSDSIWAPDAVARAVRVFHHDSNVGALSGHCRALNRDRNLLTQIQDCWYEGQFSVRKAFESVFGAVTCVSGPMAVFRREAIYNFIPAWEQDRFLGQEFRFATDRTLTGFVLAGEAKAAKLKRRHQTSRFLAVDYPWHEWKVVYSKSTRAWTAVPDTLQALVKQQVRWKKSFLRNMWFTGSFYWQRPLLPAAFYYLHALFVLVGPLVAFRHLVYMPLHGNLESMVLYLCGITLIGSMFGLAFRREEPQARHWFYRPLMSVMSTILLSWLIFYSMCTIKKMTWSRG